MVRSQKHQGKYDRAKGLRVNAIMDSLKSEKKENSKTEVESKPQQDFGGTGFWRRFISK